mmetsp:Transcript_9553/g.23821  ORF Transcript_9553/g.23821 Transcript_9553/m.23821 type:complete len:425 (-) Transcript_9553:129-1403(-)
MEGCASWEWVVFHTEASFFAVEASTKSGEWRLLELYSQDLIGVLCGVNGEHPGSNVAARWRCSFPSPATCWPAYVVASMVTSVGTQTLLNATMDALDVVMHRPVREWTRAVRLRWPVFGVLSRLLVRAADLLRARCRPSGAAAQDAFSRLVDDYTELWVSVNNQGIVPQGSLQRFAVAACPHFEQLDRSACAPWIGGSKGRIRLFGYREVISDRIRGTGQPSCALGVDAEVEHARAMAAKRGGALPRVVEVGPFLCDCLWVHAHAVQRWQAFEFSAAAAELCEETIQANSLVSTASVEVAAIGDGRPVRMTTNAEEPSWTTSTFRESATTATWIPTVRLDERLKLESDEVIDLLIMHTNGFERTVLEGAMGLLVAGRIRAIVAPLLGAKDWPTVLPNNFTLQKATVAGTSAMSFQAVAARWDTA